VTLEARERIRSGGLRGVELLAWLGGHPSAARDAAIERLLGAGLGKVAMAVHLLTGALARGVELQPELVAAASAQARELGLRGVSFVESDALDADLGDATVVFLYLPFTGEVLAGVMRRLEVVARRRQLVICTLGLDLRGTDWIAPRPTEEFWLSIYDSTIAGAEPRPTTIPLPLATLGEAIARER
jgi:hypothetical protein